MSAFRREFKKKHTFLAVIHVQNRDQMIRNMDIARRNGADGVFLINHDIDSSHLLHCYEQARNRHPSYWIGLNILGLSADDAQRIIPEDASGLWTDYAGVTDDGNVEEAYNFHKIDTQWRGLYFGGVAFKYQSPVTDFEKVARYAVDYVDVITTSGEATGSAPPLKKIIAMRKGAGTHPIAIASGMTPENVSEYLPYTDCFLVATGISDSHTELNAGLTKAFAQRMGS